MRLLSVAILFTTLTQIGMDCRPGHAQEPDHEEAEVRSRDRINDLVVELRSPEFSVRQNAIRELSALDQADLPALELAAVSADGDQARQLRPLLDRLRMRVFDQSLRDFAANPTVTTMAGLPHAKRYGEVVGVDDRALSVYREMLTAERRLFALKMLAPKELSAELETRSAEFSDQCHGRSDESFPVASCLALMMLASDPDVRLIRATSTNISDALEDPRFVQVLSDGAHSEIVTAITSEWLKRPGIAADRPLLFCIQLKLPVGRAIAIRVIESQSRRPDMMLSLLCLARLESQVDLPLVESLLENHAVLWPPRGQSVLELMPEREVESTYRVQTCDVALAVALALRKADPMAFGLHLEPSDFGLPTVESTGFDTDEQRIAAIEKYRKAFGRPSASRQD